jgi:hypothetical protein
VVTWPPGIAQRRFNEDAQFTGPYRTEREATDALRRARALPPAGLPELVVVITHARLIDSASDEHVYWRKDGKGLPTGSYVVAWPPGTAHRKFNEDAQFTGPYRSEQEALEALRRATVRWMKAGHPMPHASTTSLLAVAPWAAGR